jgi:prevent-host-death family protein
MLGGWGSAFLAPAFTNILIKGLILSGAGGSTPPASTISNSEIPVAHLTQNVLITVYGASVDGLLLNIVSQNLWLELLDYKLYNVVVQPNGRKHMEKVAVSEFRANLVAFLKRVENGEVIALTSRGHEVAKIVPPDDKIKNAKRALKKLQGTAIIGDIISPIDEEWEVLE